MNRRRTAFALVEMLVVIGILLILMTLSLLGYQVIEKSAAASQTKATLHNLDSMLADLESAAGSGALPVYTYQDAQGHTQVQNTIGAVTNSPTPDAKIWTIGDVSSGGGDRYPWPSTVSPNNPSNIVGSTQHVAMAALIRIPNNLDAIKQMPSSRLMKDPNGNPYTIPILLDGWGNPIIYVPAGGISVYVMTGNGTPRLITIVRADNRPFFASAGPDGNFGAVYTSSPTAPSYGDDNVCSKG